MAQEGHIKLASTIKSVHQKLRQEAKKIGEDKAWFEHCQKRDVLQTYAQAMSQLATEFWERNSNDSMNKKAISRVKWIMEQCEKYFFHGGYDEALSKEIVICSQFNLETVELLKHYQDNSKELKILKVLDVGSCYNPFHIFPSLDVTAIDIAPALDKVYKCDFLNLKVLERGVSPRSSPGEITELAASSFNVIIFSLLLEYLPSCKQRYVCCCKASQLLTPGGLLCIITPDSKHATANSGIMKKWRYALANEGFLRLKYEKLPHLHCMVYRKCVHPVVSKEWLLSSTESDKRKGKSVHGLPEEMMVIPQDFHEYLDDEVESSEPKVRDDDEAIASLFSDLPEL